MAYQLHIPPCIHSPHHPLHFPPHSKPLRIQIEGPTVSIQKLFPEIRWVTTDGFRTEFPQPAGPKLAELAYRTIYGCEPSTEDDDDDDDGGDLVVRDEYLRWIIDPKPIRYQFHTPFLLPCLPFLFLSFRFFSLKEESKQSHQVNTPTV
jgi:hypothetical protein